MITHNLKNRLTREDTKLIILGLPQLFTVLHTISENISYTYHMSRRILIEKNLNLVKITKYSNTSNSALFGTQNLGHYSKKALIEVSVI